MVYLLSSILLIFTVLFYFMNYLKSKKINAFLVLLAMISLLVGTLFFMFSVNNSEYYVIGHMIEFVGYVLILVNLVMILKHGKKTR